MHEIFPIILLSTSSYLLVAALYLRIRQIFTKSTLIDGFKDLLYVALGYSGSGPLVRGFEILEPKIKNKELKRLVKKEIVSERTLGRPSVETLKMLNLSTEEISGIESLVGRNMESAKENASQLEPVLQRDATINMFISTIAPSFVILAFIGSSIFSAANFIFLSSMLLCILPVLYAISLTLSQRRFIYAFKN
ncbi:MAG: hypothetical protein ACP5RT_01495 [Candidatus Micrarchaeia archaeon]